MSGHYPVEYTGVDGVKGLYCNCGGPLPCPHFVPGEPKPKERKDGAGRGTGAEGRMMGGQAKAAVAARGEVA